MILAMTFSKTVNGYIIYLHEPTKQAKHFANGDNPEQVNTEIENFIIETVCQEINCWLNLSKSTNG